MKEALSTCCVDEYEFVSMCWWSLHYLKFWIQLWMSNCWQEWPIWVKSINDFTRIPVVSAHIVPIHNRGPRWGLSLRVPANAEPKITIFIVRFHACVFPNDLRVRNQRLSTSSSGIDFYLTTHFEPLEFDWNPPNPIKSIAIITTIRRFSIKLW